MKMIQIMHVKVGEAPETFYIEPTLEAMQSLVGGLIERVSLPDGVDLWCNEEGLFNGSRPNRFVKEVGGEIRGDFFLARSDEAMGMTTGLTDTDVKRYAQIFKL